MEKEGVCWREFWVWTLSCLRGSGGLDWRGRSRNLDRRTGDMNFWHNGCDYDTEGMVQFATGQAGMPLILVDKAGRCFVQQVRKQWVGPRFRAIDRMEANRVAGQLGIVGLREHLAAVCELATMRAR